MSHPHMVQTDWGQIPASTLHIDRGIRYQIHPRTALALKALRQRTAAVMTTLMKGKTLDATGQRWFELAIQCLAMRTDDTPIGLA